MILSKTGELNSILEDEFDKFYNTSQRLSDSFYHITRSSEFNRTNKVPKHTHLAIYNSCFDVLSALTYDVIESYLTLV